MRNLKLEIEYDGSNYCGWQLQRRNKKKRSIQGVLEKTLRKVLREEIKLVGSGRTDAGVHAQAQAANFKTRSDITLVRLQRALNGLLPDDIKVSGIKEASSGFHSRFDAKSKVYRYTILNRPHSSVFLRNRVYFYPLPLKVKIMQEEAKGLKGRHNFKSFQASTKEEKDPVRVIKRIGVTRDKDLIYIDIEADGFLYNMVRNISGTLIEIGRGRFPRGSLKKILAGRNRRLAGPTLPAEGLCLVKVKY
ncbi:MAG: tRNA pseudouridine(38-40) synthase TruA [Candidatus Omnitrophica bacterium]|nr:tRNA pseudouridine(38-40) synthase TruA [Candidatus Omnitrophota bacterium]